MVASKKSRKNGGFVSQKRMFYAPHGFHGSFLVGRDRRARRFA
jgi:hypothetical protein